MNLKNIKTPFILALLLTGIMAHADAPPLTVAVFDFNSNVGAVLPKDITALVTADLSAKTNLVLVERAQLDKALGEQAFGLSGEINSDAAAKVGRLTGAKVLVAGRAIKAGDQMVIVANIIGTETSRLYAAKVQGSAADLPALTDKLSEKIAQIISDQYTNLIVVSEPHEARIDRIIKAVQGTNRPSVMISVADNLAGGRKSPNPDVITEFGLLLQKAGFTVVDENSSMKPDVQITGSVKCDWGATQGALIPCTAFVQIKVQERQSGDILALDRQQSEAVDIGKHSAAKAALLNATDGLAERILPLLAK
jgi:TolB-like protein